MGSEKYFTSIDLRSGYWQCFMADQDIVKTTFFIRYSIYKWVVIPMGLTNAPSTFMQTMKNMFPDMLNSGMVLFLDDILVYSIMVKEHFILLQKVLVCLYQYTFYCKLKKYSFLYNSTIFFGFDIMPEGVHISDLKV